MGAIFPARGSERAARSCSMGVVSRSIAMAALPFAVGCGPSDRSWLPTTWRGQELVRLEQRIESIDRQLAALSLFTMHMGAGPIGYRSAARPERQRQEWVQINLGRELPIDEIVIVPTVYRTADSELRADGFPEEFRVVAGTDDASGSTVVATITAADQLLPRIAPVIIPTDVTASWVRLEATALSPRAWDAKYVLQLSEILIFSGGENIALHRPVTASSSFASDTAARHERFLVDGVLPYLMDTATPERSAAFLTTVDESLPFALTIDLGATQLLSSMLLHTIDVSDNIPQAHETVFGIPRRLRVDAANDPEFGDVNVLCEYRMDSMLDAGPIIALRFPETPCRYVRLTVLEPGFARSDGQPVFGFAEIECFAGGNNVAAGKLVSVPHAAGHRNALRRSLAALTDGCTFYGKILPLQDWLRELARRHDLEKERPVVQAMLQARYQLQGKLVGWLLWVSGALAVVVAVSFVVEAYLRRRAIARTRAEIAADLHDELGANLHAIALCSDVAKANRSSGESMVSLLDEMRALAERSGVAIRSCVTMLEARDLYEDVAADLRRTTGRLLADIDHRLDITCEERLADLPPKLQAGLTLFYKECLTNILRHARATRVTALLTMMEGELCLTVEDDGRAVAELESKSGGDVPVPGSLRRRARLMGGRVSARASSAGGITIVLRVPTIPWWNSIRRSMHAKSDAADPRHACRG